MSEDERREMLRTATEALADLKEITLGLRCRRQELGEVRRGGKVIDIDWLRRQKDPGRDRHSPVAQGPCLL